MRAQFLIIYLSRNKIEIILYLYFIDANIVQKHLLEKNIW